MIAQRVRSESRSGSIRVVTGVVAVAALAFGLRALGYGLVFPQSGEIVLFKGDVTFHARLALYALVNFPQALLRDAYIAFPEGASVLFPPLYDWAVAGVALVFGGGEETLERVLAWAPPVLGAVTAVVVVAAGRLLGGDALGLGAGVLYAVFPASCFAGRVGNADHHAAVGLVAAGLLYTSLLLVTRSTQGRSLVAAGVLLTVFRFALLLTWSGSLLYLLMADGLLLLVAAFSGRRSLLVVVAAGSAATAALVAPLVLSLPAPVGGLYSAVALSRLHLLILIAVAIVAAVTWALGRGDRSPGPWGRVARLAGACALVGAAFAALSPVREAVLAALDFVALRDATGAATLEQRPLLPVGGRTPQRPPQDWYGWLSWLVPLSPFLPLLAARDARYRAAAWVLAGWCAVLAPLTVSQVRYANDFAAPAALAFAVGLAALGRAVAGRLPAGLGARWVIPALAGLLLVWPSWASLHRSMLDHTLRAARSETGIETSNRSLRRFAMEVRALTPETSGYLDPQAVPEYGILADGNLGHSLRYWARRPVMLDQTWDYPAPELFRRASRALLAPDEAEALELIQTLRARYMVTVAVPGMFGGGLQDALHLHDGLAHGSWRRLEHFRLVTEGPAQGVPLRPWPGGRAPRGMIPYKLFEIVEGAVLEIRGTPGQRVSATTALRTPLHRSILYQATGVVGPEGSVRLRVPYSTDGALPVRAASPYLVRVGGSERSVSVPEDAVTTGRVILVP